MKKRMIALAMSAAMAISACVCGISTESYAATELSHKTYMTAETDDYYEALTIFYKEDSDKLMMITDETHFSKDSGYTEDMIESYDVNEVYPGFTDAEYTGKEIYDDGDYITIVCKFMDLDKHWKDAVEDGILTINEGEDASKAAFMKASSICDSAVASGYTELTDEQAEEYGFHFDFED